MALEDADGAHAVTTPPAGRRDRRRAENQQRLLDAAEHAFLTKGIAGATINDITDLADLGFGTFYSYFDSKEEAAAAVAERLARDLAGPLVHRARATDDPAEALALVLVGIARHNRDRPGAAQILLEAGGESGVLEREFGPLIWQILHDGVARSRFDQEHADHGPWAIASLLLGTMFYRLSGASGAGAEESLAFHALRLVGVERAEASAIARWASTATD